MKTLLLGAALAVVAIPLSAQHHATPHWEYEGAQGPAKWGSLDAAYAKCGAGREQSPIDIRQSTVADLPPITFSYHAAPLALIDNGHTIQVNYAAWSFITVGHERYDLVQFHFHHPAEERVQGKPYPMVAHLVHRNRAGHLAVVAVLMEKGAPNSLIETLWANLPGEKGKEAKPHNVSVDATALLPVDRGYYTFEGSLTTPPCTEGVRWFVLKKPDHMSQDEIVAFAHRYPHNARPLQPVNGRTIQQTK